VPFLLVAGDREVEAHTLAVRTRSGKRPRQLEFKELTALLLRRSREPRPSCLEDRLSQRRRRVSAMRRFSAPSVRVIAADGKPSRVMTRAEALQLATSQTLDLVEVSPMAEPPVVRVMDFGNSCSNRTRKAHAASESRSRFQVKEIKFRPARKRRITRSNCVTSSASLPRVIRPR